MIPPKSPPNKSASADEMVGADGALALCCLNTCDAMESNAGGGGAIVIVIGGAEKAGGATATGAGRGCCMFICCICFSNTSKDGGGFCAVLIMGRGSSFCLASAVAVADVIPLSALIIFSFSNSMEVGCGGAVDACLS